MTLRHCHDPFNRSESNLSAIPIRSFVASRSIPLDVTGHPSSIAWIEVVGSNLNGAKWNYAVNFRPKGIPREQRGIGYRWRNWDTGSEFSMNGESCRRKCRNRNAGNVSNCSPLLKIYFFFETKCYTYRDGNEIGIVKLNYTVFSANFGFFFFLRYIAMSRDIYRRWRNWNIGNISKRFEYFFFFFWKLWKLFFREIDYYT